MREELQGKTALITGAGRRIGHAVAPGLILPPLGKDEAYLNQLAQLVPLKRHGGPRDICDAVIYLLKSTFLTGQVIYVDGGRHLLEYSNGSHPG